MVSRGVDNASLEGRWPGYTKFVSTDVRKLNLGTLRNDTYIASD